jgi:hypothetical protein
MAAFSRVNATSRLYPELPVQRQTPRHTDVKAIQSPLDGQQPSPHRLHRIGTPCRSGRGSLRVISSSISDTRRGAGEAGPASRPMHEPVPVGPQLARARRLGLSAGRGLSEFGCPKSLLDRSMSGFTLRARMGRTRLGVPPSAIRSWRGDVLPVRRFSLGVRRDAGGSSRTHSESRGGTTQFSWPVTDI